MTTPHRATPDEWEAVGLHADPDAYCHRDSCILELHYRVEALEAQQQQQAASEESSAAQDDDPQTLHVRRAIREPMEQSTPPATPTPATQRAQRLLDELEEGGLPAVLRHLAAVWSVGLQYAGGRWFSATLLDCLADELEGREVEQSAPHAACALVAAFDDQYENCGPFDNWQELCIAAVLRHLAAVHGDPESFGSQRPELLERLAAELEAT
jgi:hypothetical protein